MPHQDSDNVPVTFQDVAASFSDEEWTLLQRWQKELYQNVMKEIQQALHSLGPVIATHVFSLRTKEKEDLNPFEEADSETRHSDDEPSALRESLCVQLIKALCESLCIRLIEALRESLCVPLIEALRESLCVELIEALCESLCIQLTEELRVGACVLN
ncbi:hypothetical protein NDU88_000180 [Pleurodeles waltl]|uniref:KRAB domain-containing protein n=1 Tax=Pleurodeles waltl TaxID=8319 RepID=A0AAV7P3F1_PLEWA|nr:hypothetical protein NDU88_000180 [Pleurodeles waltl]